MFSFEFKFKNCRNNRKNIFENAFVSESERSNESRKFIFVRFHRLHLLQRNCWLTRRYSWLTRRDSRAPCTRGVSPIALPCMCRAVFHLLLVASCAFFSFQHRHFIPPWALPPDHTQWLNIRLHHASPSSSPTRTHCTSRWWPVINRQEEYGDQIKRGWVQFFVN